MPARVRAADPGLPKQHRCFCRAAYSGEMGCYDEVHGGWQCGQTKGLGKGLRRLLPGDSVELIPAPMDEAAYELYVKGQAHVRPERDFLLAMSEGGYITVRDGSFVKWARSACPGLPIFDSLGLPFLGRPLKVAVKVVSEQARDCAACAAVRSGRVADYRAELEAARSEVRDVAAQRRADRARAGFRSV